nr:hypothetical protein [Actinomycetales bacterium]
MKRTVRAIAATGVFLLAGAGVAPALAIGTGPTAGSIAVSGSDGIAARGPGGAPASGFVALEDPFSVTTRVTDLAEVLTPGEITQINDAIDALGDSSNIDLFVVYVDTFSGMDAGEWAGDSAELSGLGMNDLLLTVAVEDRAWAVSADNQSDVPPNEAQRLFVSSGERDLANDNWARAPISYAEAIESSLAPAASTGSGFPFGILFLGVAVIAGAIYFFSRRGKKGATRGAPSEPQLDQLPLEELSKRAGAALVQVDNELRASEQELGFAQAQFGLQATESYSRAIALARKDATRAFEVQKKLDDHIPDTDAEKRSYFLTIITTAEKVHTALAGEKKSFDELRAMESRAGEVLDEVATRSTEVAARVEGARSIVTSLAAQYTASALASVSQNPDQAEGLLLSAEQAIQAGRERLAAEDRSAAVVNARIAEQAIGNAAKLLDQVHGANEALEDAGPKISEAL